jgi:hypothetical protein
MELLMIVRIFSFCFFVDKMNPTRHIMKEKDSELAIFCSGKKQMDPTRHIMKKKNSELANILFLEKKKVPNSPHHEEKKF